MKTIFITGSTDGIGYATAKMLLSDGHRVIVHGINENKVTETQAKLKDISGKEIPGYSANLTDRAQIDKMITAIKTDFESIDVLINNAGVFVVKGALTASGYDIRFVVNTFAPFYLTNALQPMINERVVNLSSAAQASVDIEALTNGGALEAGSAYAQSKLAITMWGAHLGALNKENKGPLIISVNPKSFLGSQMVKDAYAVQGHDLNIGADILTRASLSKEFEGSYGAYFNNDIGQFDQPHIDARDAAKNKMIYDLVSKLSEKF